MLTLLYFFFLLCFDSVANNWLYIAFGYYNPFLAFSWLLWHWYFLTVQAICSAESLSVNLSEYVFIIRSCLNILARMFSRWWALLIAHNIRLLCYQCCEFDFSILFHIHPTNSDNVLFDFCLFEDFYNIRCLLLLSHSHIEAYCSFSKKCIRFLNVFFIVDFWIHFILGKKIYIWPFCDCLKFKIWLYLLQIFKFSKCTWKEGCSSVVGCKSMYVHYISLYSCADHGIWIFPDFFWCINYRERC